MATRPTIVQFVATKKIDGKGRLILPQRLRRELGLGAGASCALFRLGGGLIVLPERRSFELLCRGLSKALLAGESTPEEILATLPRSRAAIYKLRYGKARRSRG